MELSHRGLLPCGGALFVQLTVAAALLDATCGGDSSGARHEERVKAAVAAARQLLRIVPAAGDSGGADEFDALHVCHAAVVKTVSAEAAALHFSRPAMQPFQSPPPHSSVKAHKFMRLEPLALPEDTIQRHHGWDEGQRPAAAVLHAHKSAQHMLLRFSCRRPAHTWHQEELQALAPPWRGSGNVPCRVRGLCRDLDACVVAVDVALFFDRCDCTWLLFVAEGQDRALLRDAIARHFG